MWSSLFLFTRSQQIFTIFSSLLTILNFFSFDFHYDYAYDLQWILEHTSHHM